MNIWRTSVTVLSLLVTAFSHHTHAQSDVLSMAYPRVPKYMAGPPDTTSLDFAFDVNQYFAAKTLRDSDRGRQALNDVEYSSVYIATRMSPTFGLTITNTRYPKLRSLYLLTVSYLQRPGGAAKTYYNRRRPFVRFHDPLFSTENAGYLSQQGSYPSSHSLLGWGAALLLSSINPTVQDDLFDVGYEYGQSRIITGAHWQSDVSASRMIASATFARLMGNDAYLDMYAQAQAEYDSVTHNTRPTSLDRFHPVVNYFPTPPDSSGTAFAADVATYYGQKALRDSERGAQALTDIDASVAGMARTFAPLLGIAVNEQQTPAIWRLLQTALPIAEDNCTHQQENNPRTPPYRRLNESAMPGTVSSSVSSYPSRHAALGWVAAMLMMDVCPARQDQLLARGRQYGQSRVIAGTNWQSDVDAGQLLGGMVFANLVSSAQFRELMAAARDEFNAISAVATIHADKPRNGEDVFTIDGRSATKDTQGIVITGDGKKILKTDTER